MNPSCLVWIDRLKLGSVQKIAETLSPAFLQIQEEQLRFESPVLVQGEAYLSQEQLILRLKASTQAKMPCAICNQMVEIALAVGHFYHTQPTSEIPSGIFDFREPLREALLLEVPQYIECKTSCPERSTISPYLRPGNPIQQETYFPFKDLDS